MIRLLRAAVVAACCIAPWANAKNTPPTTYTFNDNDTVPVVLSSVDINRLVVKDDKITGIDCPAGFCVVSGTKSDTTGAARLKLNIAVPFVAYVGTKKGRQFGMFITPRARPAVTSEFIGRQNTRQVPSVFDKTAPYTTQLAEFTAQMIRWTQTGDMMGGFSLHPVDPKTVASALAAPLAVIPDTVFVGKPFSGIRYRVKNNTATVKQLSTAQFYSLSARSAALSATRLAPNETAWLYIVTGGPRR
ncbi:type-F conjugative transfer system secretin TraK [Pseudomonadota bacterium]